MAARTHVPTTRAHDDAVVTQWAAAPGSIRLRSPAICPTWSARPGRRSRQRPPADGERATRGFAGADAEMWAQIDRDDGPYPYTDGERAELARLLERA